MHDKTFGFVTVALVLAVTALTAGVASAQTAGGATLRLVVKDTTGAVTRRHSVRAGVRVEGGFYDSDTRSNYLGTFTFASLADFEAGRPSAYTRRLGDPLVKYSQWQVGLFVLDHWRVRQNLTLSGGLRKELQTNLDDRLNLAPRPGLTWSPFKHGRTTVRAGGGIFDDRLDASTFKQTQRVDGQRQQEIVIRNPGDPNPYAGAAGQQVLPESLISNR